MIKFLVEKLFEILIKREFRMRRFHKNGKNNSQSNCKLVKKMLLRGFVPVVAFEYEILMHHACIRF